MTQYRINWYDDIDMGFLFSKTFFFTSDVNMASWSEEAAPATPAGKEMTAILTVCIFYSCKRKMKKCFSFLVNFIL